jgi:hypothetical protein
MPMYDRRCAQGHEKIDCWEPISAPDVACLECGERTERVMLSKASSVSQDSIEGGVWIRHGLCWPDGSPRRFDSKSEIAREAKARGLVQSPRHVDGDKHLSRWI